MVIVVVVVVVDSGAVVGIFAAVVGAVDFRMKAREVVEALVNSDLGVRQHPFKLTNARCGAPATGKSLANKATHDAWSSTSPQPVRRPRVETGVMASANWRPRHRHK